MFSIIILSIFFYSFGFQFREHPFEKRAGYISGLNKIQDLPVSTVEEIQNLFKKHPLLVIQKIKQPYSLEEFRYFLSFFDTENGGQSECIQEIHSFGNQEQYVWRSDLLGNNLKNTPIVSGIQIVKNMLDSSYFISGESIYQSLTPIEKEAAKNILIEINQMKFFLKKSKTDYWGCERIEPFESIHMGNQQIPLVFAPEIKEEIPSIILMPIIFEKIVGWSVKDSREWLKYFMQKNVLPRRFSVQLEKGDICVVNNRRIMYLDTFQLKTTTRRICLPTQKPLCGIVPDVSNIYQCMNSAYYSNWISNKQYSGFSYKAFREYYRSKPNINGTFQIYPQIQ